MVLVELGDLEQARSLLEESLAESRATNCGEGIASALQHRAGLGRRQRDQAGATSHCLEGLRLYKKLGLQLNVAECLELLGGLACDGSQPERAARLFAAGDQLRQAIGVPVAPVGRAQLERDVGRARAALGSDRFAVHCDAGRTMTLDEAIALGQ